MPPIRNLIPLSFTCSLLTVTACGTNPYEPPPSVAKPAIATPLGLGAAYLTEDVIKGRHSRAVRLRTAGIKPIPPGEAQAYMDRQDSDLRSQIAGIGVDVIRRGDELLVRIPAALTFDPGSADIKPQFDATLNEVARTLKTYNQTYVDVLGHTDTTGAPAPNQLLSDRRASAVAAYFASHGVARARIASKGYGETAPLYDSDDTEMKRAANRRVEIRVVPARQNDLR